jgi:hypothetical protein
MLPIMYNRKELSNGGGNPYNRLYSFTSTGNSEEEIKVYTNGSNSSTLSKKGET